MIYPRLKVARDLLSDDGVIFISIDDNEVDNLRKICDELFGQDNLVAQFIWEQGRKSMAAQVAINHEYCLAYSKNKKLEIANDNIVENRNWLSKKAGLDKIYAEVERLKSLYNGNVADIEKGLSNFYKSLSDGDPAKAQSHYKKFDPKLGIYYQGDISQGTGKGGRFPILHPITGLPCKLPSGGWRFSESKLPELLRENRIAFGADENTVPCLKRFLKETEYEVCSSVFYKDGRGASKRLDALIGKGIFDYPKDEEIIKNFIKWVTSYVNTEDIILDFFSGSATTAHAVMKLNAEDKGHRKFIMIQLPEVTDEKSEARKAGYKTICEIGKERIRRAGKQILESVKTMNGDLFDATEANFRLDVGFRVLKLDTSNMENVLCTPNDFDSKTLFSQIENIKPDRTSMDLLFQVMLQCGCLLSDKIKESDIAGKRVYDVADGYLMACFDRDVDESTVTEIAKLQPLYFVMCDASAADDNIMDNFEQIFRHYSPDTICKII
jgi:adenine-specific DNA-methyltransferase